MKKASNLLICLLFIFCSKDLTTGETEGILIRINSYTQSCQGLIEQQCYLVQQGDAIGSENWALFYDEIEGFDFIPGFVYDLEVSITERNPVPQDVGKYKYTLIKEIRRTAAD